MELQKQIEQLYEAALSLQNQYIVVDICIVDNELGERIKAFTGLDFTGYILSIDNYSIRHTLEKHGNPLTEAKRGQISIVLEDFILLPKILKEFDKVRLDVKVNSTKNTKRESLVFEKLLDNKYFVIKEIRTVTKKGKKNRLMLQTMYKQKTPLS